MRLTQVLFEWMLTSAFLILAVAALRALLGKRVSAGLRYALWAVVLARLLVPVQLFTTRTSILRETGVEQLVAPPELVVPAPVQSYDLPDPTQLPDGTVIHYQPGPTNVTVRQEPLTVLQALGWLWLAGSAAMAAAFAVSNWNFSRRLRRVRAALKGADCPLPVYLAEGLPSPCLFGVFRPAIYMTPETAADPAMLRHVLAHEYTHFRHGDHIWNVLRGAALAIHWWNPLVWLAVALSRRDCELACDEGALKRLGGEERFAYGRTLLALITVKPRPSDLLRCATTMTGEEKSVWERVNHIARAPKRWLWAAVAVVLTAALACLCAFGSAQMTEPHGEPEPDPSPAASFDLGGLTADLTFSLDQTGEEPIVRIDGSVGDVVLTRGAFWYSEAVWEEEHPLGELSMVYPAFTDGIEGSILAWWADEGRTSVTVSTLMQAMLSSYFPTGYWTFTVELGSGTVTEMNANGLQKAPHGLETRMYPGAISDEEAVAAARVAAKLLTAAEDYYSNSTHTPSDLYREVLLGERDFLLREDEGERPLNIADVPGLFDNSSPYTDIDQFAALDLDGDGAQEVIAHVASVSGDMGGYLLLHQADGQVYGIQWHNPRTFWNLKTDGTFETSDLLGSTLVVESLAITDMRYIRDALAWGTMSDPSAGEFDTFVIGHKEATRAEYDAFMARQNEKPDEPWFDFTRIAIKVVFPY